MKKKEEAKPKQKKRTIPKIVHDLTHARNERGQCLASIFRSLPKGAKRTSKLDITYKFGDETMQYMGIDILGVDDMRFFQTFVALAGPSEAFVKLDGSARTELGQYLASAMNPKNYATKMQAIMVKETTFYKVLKEAGYNPNKPENVKSLNASLKRLSNVTLHVDSKEYIFSSSLMAYSIDKETNHLSILLNPIVSRSIVGRRVYTWIDMNEVRSLKTDPARLLHERLCAWIDGGETRQVSIDKVIAYIYPDKATESTTRKRRERARKALLEIAKTGWKIEESSKGICTITRPQVLHINKEIQDKKEES